MPQYIDKDLKIVDIRDWLLLHLRLLEEDVMAAYMQCRCREIENTLILCNIDLIPEGYTIDDIVNIVEGKHIKLWHNT